MPDESRKSLVLDAAVIFAFVSALASVFGWSYERGFAGGFGLPESLLGFDFQDGLLAFLHVVGDAFWAAGLPVALAFAALGLGVLGWQVARRSALRRRIVRALSAEGFAERTPAERVLFGVGYTLCFVFGLIIVVFGMLSWSERAGRRDGAREAALARRLLAQAGKRADVVHVTYMVGEAVTQTSGFIVFSKANEVAVYTASGPLVIARDKLVEIDRATR